MRPISLLLLALSAAPGFAQDPLPLAPPLLGYAYDPATSSILRVSGVPGAALFDAAIPVEPRLPAVFVAPNGSHAVAVGLQKEASLLRWPDARLSARPMDGGLEDASVVFSVSGSAAVLYTDLSAPVQVWTGLPDAPRIAAVRHTGFDGVLGAIAVSDQGEVALAITMAGFSRVLLLGDGSGRTLASGGRFTALAFSPDGSELLAADAEREQVWALRARDVNPAPRLLASKEDGVADPVGAAYSRDGGLRIVAGRQGRVIRIEPSGVARAAECECRIDGLHRLRGEAVFRLVDPPKGRTPVFDGDGEEPRVVFLPMEEQR